MKQTLRICVLLFISGLQWGQAQDSLLVYPKKIDSLKQRIDKQAEFNEEKVTLLNEYARLCFYNRDFKTGLIATRDARIISEKINFKGGEVMYHLSLAAFMGDGRPFEHQNLLAEKISVEEDLAIYYKPVVVPEDYLFEFTQKIINLLMPVRQYFKDIGDTEIQALLQIMIINSLYTTEQYDASYDMLESTIAIYIERGELFPAFDLYGWKRHLVQTEKVQGNIEQIRQELLDLISTITDKKVLANAYYQLGTYEQFTNKNISDAVEYYLMSIKYSEQFEPTGILLTVYDRMSKIYQDLDLWPKRTEYILKIIALKKKKEINPDLYQNYQRALWCMYNIKKYDKAHAYMDSLQVSHRTDQQKKELEILNNTLRGQVLMDQEQYKKAAPFLINAYEGYIAMNNKYAPPYEAIHIADCHIKLGDYGTALKYALISHEWHLKKPDDLRIAKETNSRLAEIYGAMGKKQKAYNHLFKYHKILKEQKGLNTTGSIMDVEMRSILNKSQEQIGLLEKEQFIKEQENKTQRLWIFSIAGGLISAILILLLLYRSNKSKQKANTLLNQQKQEIEQQKNKAENTLTELKATQAQLIQSEKMASLGELTAGIAHEIQNPLNFVNNFSEVSNELIDEMNEELDKGDIDEAKAISLDLKLNLEKINHHGKRADGIVKGMLQHSRSSSVTKELTDINNLADEYLRLAFHGLRAKDKTFNASLNTDFDETIGSINVFPQDIGRVILNLITNAFYAVTEKKKSCSGNYDPTVTVKTKKSGNNVEVQVTDNGNGIPQKALDKIFQPFFTTKPTGQGTGLGLSLSYDIVKAHGGELKVETKEGEGSTFSIIIPVAS
jgi:two-component system NtrC family sensor kinase